MKTIWLIAIVLCALLRMSTTAFAADWKQLPPIPDANGFAGAFAGVCDGKLLFAGGANFPDKKPWEDGQKVWYDRIISLDQIQGTWRQIGTLPRPLGYGVSVTYHGGMICAGGSDAKGHYADVFRIVSKNGRISFRKLPPLPKTIANACGALAGDHFYVAGGQESPTSTSALATLFELDLSKKGARWRELAPCPGGGRIFAVAATIGDDFYLISGASLSAGSDGKVTRQYLRDVWRYRINEGWKRMADLPQPVLGAPSPAPSGSKGFTILGGDDGLQVNITPPQGHKGFSNTIFRFDAAANAWKSGESVRAARANTPCVRWGDLWVIPSGEQFPGIRSPEVWGLKAK